MKPTMKLRFVERETKVQPFDCLYPTVKVVRVLQQWWEQEHAEQPWLNPRGKWRDVPVETEEAK